MVLVTLAKAILDKRICAFQGSGTFTLLFA